MAAANKRIQNLLKKAETVDPAPDASLFLDPAEHALFNVINALGPRVVVAVEKHDYTGALQALASVRAPVDNFFDAVMVMAEDAKVRNNRLALLRMVGDLLNRVADISKLA